MPERSQSVELSTLSNAGVVGFLGDSMLVAVSSEKRACVWDATNGQVANINGLEDDINNVHAVAFSNTDSSCVAVCTKDSNRDIQLYTLHYYGSQISYTDANSSHAIMELNYCDTSQSAYVITEKKSQPTKVYISSVVTTKSSMKCNKYEQIVYSCASYKLGFVVLGLTNEAVIAKAKVENDDLTMDVQIALPHRVVVRSKKMAKNNKIKNGDSELVPITAIDGTEDGGYLATGGQDGSIVWWATAAGGQEVSEGQPSVLTGHNAQVCT